MTHEQLPQWQRHVARAILSPSDYSAADKLHLLAEWPLLRPWAQSALRRNPEKVMDKTLDAYLRDALAWSGHLGNPAEILSAQANDGIEDISQKPSMLIGESEDVTPHSVSGSKIKDKAVVTTPSAPGNPSKKEDDSPQPIHFDQYRNHIPIELQQRYDEEISDLYLLRTELANRRDQLAKEVENAMYGGDEKIEDQASTKLAEVAQQLVNADVTIRGFWALVDVAFRFYQLNGEVMTIEDLREQAPIPLDSSAGKRQRAARTPDYTKAEIEAMFSTLVPGADDYEARLAEVKAAKAERIRKNANYLRDKRKAENAHASGGEIYNKWCEQIILRSEEMEAWGEPLTAVQQEIVASVTPA